jgi:hypothetical protein
MEDDALEFAHCMPLRDRSTAMAMGFVSLDVETANADGTTASSACKTTDGNPEGPLCGELVVFAGLSR